MEAAPPPRLVRSLELRLLRCTNPSDEPPSTPFSSSLSSHPLIETLLQLIESGSYAQALSSDAAKSVFTFGSEVEFTDTAESAEMFYSQLVPKCVEAFAGQECEEQCFRAFLVMALGVAALLAFTQCNITGPHEKMPALPILPFGDSWEEWEIWAIKDTMSVTSDLQGKFYNLQHLVLAKVLLMKTKDLLWQSSMSTGVRSISWWLFRLLLVHQKLLDGLSSSLFNLLQVASSQSLHNFGTLANVTNYWDPELTEQDARTMVSVLHLEVGTMELIYAREDSSRLHFDLAQKESKLEYSESGARGFNTKHQENPVPQLMLVTNKNSNAVSSLVSTDIPGDDSLLHASETLEASDVLMAPRMSEIDDQVCNIGDMQLKAVHQAVIMAQCLAIKKAARIDEYQLFKMGPYLQAIDSQRSSHFMIRFRCNILRVEWETTRTRTMQRALMMLNKLVDSLNEPFPVVTERIYYCFSIDSPTIPAVRKEYGDLLVRCGLIGEAIKVFEDLELWDNLIVCYTLLEKKAAAVELINTELSKRPRDPRLWCSLGDITLDDTCYQKALEVSDQRSARAFRSLARIAYNRGDYQKSMVLWDSAMKINTLYTGGWFSFGFAALKAGDFEKAADAFTYCVQLDPDNGEAWNNLAFLHLRNKKDKAAFIALKEALKFKRQNWHMWDNLSVVAFDVGHFGQSMEAIQMVLDLTKCKTVNIDLLKKLMSEIERQASNAQSTVAVSDGDSVQNDEKVVSKRDFENFMQMIGMILKKIVQSSPEADIWGLYGRWHRLKGDLRMCAEALLKQTRAYQGSDLWKDKERFVKFASASLELCKVYLELSQETGSRKELHTSEMHLKNIIKQGASFSDTQEYQDISACLNQVQKALQENQF